MYESHLVALNWYNYFNVSWNTSACPPNSSQHNRICIPIQITSKRGQIDEGYTYRADIAQGMNAVLSDTQKHPASLQPVDSRAPSLSFRRNRLPGVEVGNGTSVPAHFASEGVCYLFSQFSLEVKFSCGDLCSRFLRIVGFIFGIFACSGIFA